MRLSGIPRMHTREEIARTETKHPTNRRCILHIPRSGLMWEFLLKQWMSIWDRCCVCFSTLSLYQTMSETPFLSFFQNRAISCSSGDTVCAVMGTLPAMDPSQNDRKHRVYPGIVPHPTSYTTDFLALCGIKSPLKQAFLPSFRTKFATFSELAWATNIARMKCTDCNWYLV